MLELLIDVAFVAQPQGIPLEAFCDLRVEVGLYEILGRREIGKNILEETVVWVVERDTRHKTQYKFMPTRYYFILTYKSSILFFSRFLCYLA
jgi:hypothetical protein